MSTEIDLCTSDVYAMFGERRRCANTSCGKPLSVHNRETLCFACQLRLPRVKWGQFRAARRPTPAATTAPQAKKEPEETWTSVNYPLLVNADAAGMIIDSETPFRNKSRVALLCARARRDGRICRQRKVGETAILVWLAEKVR